jgi:hypothetical protein
MNLINVFYPLLALNKIEYLGNGCFNAICLDTKPWVLICILLFDKLYADKPKIELMNTFGSLSNPWLTFCSNGYILSLYNKLFVWELFRFSKLK